MADVGIKPAVRAECLLRQEAYIITRTRACTACNAAQLQCDDDEGARTVYTRTA